MPNSTHISHYHYHESIIEMYVKSSKLKLYNWQNSLDIKAVNPGIQILNCFPIPKSWDYDRIIPRISGSENGLKDVNFMS